MYIQSICSGGRWYSSAHKHCTQSKLALREGVIERAWRSGDRAHTEGDGAHSEGADRVHLEGTDRAHSEETDRAYSEGTDRAHSEEMIERTQR
jgi:hypothetical protein